MQIYLSERITNTIIFLFSLRLIAYFITYCYKNKICFLVEQGIIISIIFLNLLGGYDSIIFGIHASIVEPLGIACYFLSLFIYIWNKDKTIKFFNYLYYIQGLMCIFILLISFYAQIPYILKTILRQYIKNTVISLISLKITFSIERFIFNKIEYKIKNPYNQFISVTIGQLFDTAFYTILIFYNRSIAHIIEIFLFSYSIKLFCISIFTYFLNKSKL